MSPEATRLVNELIQATLIRLEQDDEIDALRDHIERLEMRAEEYQRALPDGWQAGHERT